MYLGSSGNLHNCFMNPYLFPIKVVVLSLYSTVTQNHPHWVLALAQTPNAIISHWGYQHIGILKMLKFALPPTRNIKFALPPTQNPNASQWKIGCVGSPKFSCWPCTFHVVYAHFICVGYPKRTQFAVEYTLKTGKNVKLYFLQDMKHMIVLKSGNTW